MGNPIAAQATSGPLHACPCPWCKKPNDFSTVDHLIVETDVSQGTGDPGGGPVFACDHCGQSVKVVAVRVTKVLSLRQVK